MQVKWWGQPGSVEGFWQAFLAFLVREQFTLGLELG